MKVNLKALNITRIVAFIITTIMLLSLSVQTVYAADGIGYIAYYLRGNKVPVDGSEAGFDAQISFYNDEATVRMSSSDITSLVNKNKEVGWITVDITSALDKNDSGVEVAKFYSSALKQIVTESEKKDVSIDGFRLILSSGIFEFPIDTLKTLVNKATGYTIDFVLRAVGKTKLNSKQLNAIQGFEVLTGFEMYIASNSRYVSNFTDKTFTISFDKQIAGTKNPYGASVWYVSDTGTISDMKVKFNDDRFEFNTGIFSDYIVAFNENDIGMYDNCPKDTNCPLYGLIDTDMSKWYHDSIHFILSRGLMDKSSSIKFRPDEPTTRAEIVEAIWRMEDCPGVIYNMLYEDVDTKHTNYDAIAWASSRGIVNGYSDTAFGPEDPITREQMVCILYRYCEYKGYSLYNGSSTDLAFFKDFEDISSWAMQSLRWAVGSNIIQGKGNGYIDPLGTATRAEISTMLMNFILEDRKSIFD